MVKGRKHHPATRGHLQGREAVVFGVKVGRHAAIDLAILPHTSPERHALQVALEGVAPLVIRADKLFFVAMTLTAKLHAPVGANVFHHMDLAALSARHDDRALAHHGALEVAPIRDLGFEAHITPVAFVKEARQFLLVPVFVGVDGKRDAAGAGRFPVDGVFGHKVSKKILTLIMANRNNFVNRNSKIIIIRISNTTRHGTCPP